MRPKVPARRRLGNRPRFRPAVALRRRPRLWWALTVSFALAAGWWVSSVVARAEGAERSWGRPEAVLVARHEIRAGEALDEGDVTVEHRPRPLVPAGALTALPEGAVARADVLAGEVVVTARLSPSGLRGAAARMPPGSRAIAIPVEAALAPPLAVGDHVDIIVALPPEAAGAGPPAFPIARDVPVVARADAAVTVAVSPDQAARIASGLGQGAVTVVLVGG